MGFFNLFEGMDISTTCTSNCASCGAYMHCKSAKLEGSVGTNDILLILPQPTETEDAMGACGYGEEYTWLRRQFSDVGISFNECSKINLTGCFGATNKDAVSLCRNRIDNFIKLVKPKLVIAFGSDSLDCTVGVDWTRSLGDIEKWHSFTIPFRRWADGTWLVHVESPKEIVMHESLYKNEKWKSAKSFSEKVEAILRTGFYRMHTHNLKEGIRNAYLKSKNEPIPKRPETLITPYVFTEDEALVFLEKNYMYLKENPEAILTFDLETNMLKAYNNNAKVYSCAVLADTSLGSGAFRITDKTKQAFIKLFTLKPKVCGANVKFDYVWNVVKLGMNPDDFNIHFDTVLMAHLLDNRDGVTSLKFNTYTLFGIAYESDAHTYLESSEAGCNAENRVFEAPEHTILFYNALDVIYTYAVMLEQEKLWEKEENPKKEFARKLYFETSIAFANMEIVGIPMDEAKIAESEAFCNAKLAEIEEAIKDHPVWKEWGEFVGEDTRSILSDTQIINFFIKHKGLFPTGISKRAKPKADHEWLTKMLDQEPFLQYVLDYRKYNKMVNTYIRGYRTEINDDGRIRSFYTLNNVSSFRSASNSPNGQNQASRDKQQVSLLKSCYVPPSGWYITSCDFSGLENAISANVTNDPMMRMCVDGSVDSHLINAQQAFFFNDDEYAELKRYDEENGTKMAKTLRNGGKSGISFPILYGGAKEVVATACWKYIQDYDVHVSPTETAMERIIERLDMESRYTKMCTANPKKVIDKEEAFYKMYEDYIQEVIDDFWKNRFKVTNDWRNDTFESFLNTGKIHYPTGLTIRGLGSRNFLLNAPIQGSGNCCTMLALTIFERELKKRGFKGRPVAQVHDDILGLVPAEELDEYLALQKYVMEVVTQKVFPWITQQLRVEAEVSDVSWADKKPYDGFLELYEKKYLS